MSFSVMLLWFFIFVYIMGLFVYIGVVVSDLIGKTSDWKGALRLVLFGTLSLTIAFILENKIFY